MAVDGRSASHLYDLTMDAHLSSRPARDRRSSSCSHASFLACMRLFRPVRLAESRSLTHACVCSYMLLQIYMPMHTCVHVLHCTFSITTCTCLHTYAQPHTLHTVHTSMSRAWTSGLVGLGQAFGTTETIRRSHFGLRRSARHTRRHRCCSNIIGMAYAWRL